MKPISDVYPNGYAYDYDPLLESFGYDILLKVDDDDYQGDSRLIFRDGSRYGLLIFGWGSCSGCDALQGCDTLEEIEELRTDLQNDIRWGTAEELLAYITGKDWEVEWSYHSGETKAFLEQATALLRKAIERA